jgi:transcriptional regulator with XRE-family HTH domain
MHLSQEQVARLLGVDRSTISSYESNVRQPPLDTLSRIADVFGVSTDYLLGRTSDLSFGLFDLSEEDQALLNQMASKLMEKNRRIRQLQER